MLGGGIAAVVARHQVRSYPSKMGKDRIYGAAQHQPGWSASYAEKVQLIIASDPVYDCWRESLNGGTAGSTGLHVVVGKASPSAFDVHVDFHTPTIGVDTDGYCVYGGMNMVSHLWQTTGMGSYPKEPFTDVKGLLKQTREKLWARGPGNRKDAKKNLTRLESELTALEAEWESNRRRWAVRAADGAARARDFRPRVEKVDLGIDYWQTIDIDVVEG